MSSSMDLSLLRKLVIQARIAGGAVAIHAPEVDVYVLPDGTPQLERLEADSPSRRAVSEAMILTGEVAARFCIEARMPAIYRRQAIHEPVTQSPHPTVRLAVALTSLEVVADLH